MTGLRGQNVDNQWAAKPLFRASVHSCGQLIKLIIKLLNSLERILCNLIYSSNGQVDTYKVKQ